jgi:hypothetical protein
VLVMVVGLLVFWETDDTTEEEPNPAPTPIEAKSYEVLILLVCTATHFPLTDS